MVITRKLKCLPSRPWVIQSTGSESNSEIEILLLPSPLYSNSISESGAKGPGENVGQMEIIEKTDDGGWDCINCSIWCLTSVAEQPRCHNICLSQPEPDIHFSFKQTKRQKFQKLGIQKEDICMGGCMVMVKNRICCLITLASPSPSPSTNTTSVFPLQLPELHKKHQSNDAFQQ